MTFTVGVAKSLQAIAYVKREGVFHAWWLDDEHRGDHPNERLEFGIHLATLVECLKMCGTGAGGPAAGSRVSVIRVQQKSSLHRTFCIKSRQHQIPPVCQNQN